VFQSAKEINVLRDYLVKPEGSSFELPPAGGAIEGEVVALIDLGTQRSNFQREEGAAPRWWRQVFIVWELPTKRKADPEYNHVIGKVFTFSTHEKSALGQLLRQLGYRFDDRSTFDFTQLIGQKHQLTIEHRASSASPDGSRKYARVTNVSPLHPTVVAAMPPAKHPKIIYDLDTDLTGTPETRLPCWLPFVFGQPAAAVVKLSQEWQRYVAARDAAPAAENRPPDASPAYREGAY
jgi:hypothetical protein